MATKAATKKTTVTDDEELSTDAAVETFEQASHPLIFSTMSRVMKDVTAIVKKKQQGAGVNYAFRSIEDVMNVLHPVLVNNGLVIVPRVLDVKNEMFTTANNKTARSAVLTMEYTFYALDGSNVVASIVAESTDYSDKATQQAASYCFKDLLCKTFCIPTIDMQDDGDGHQPDIQGAKKYQSKAQNLPRLSERPIQPSATPTPPPMAPETSVAPPPMPPEPVPAPAAPAPEGVVETAKAEVNPNVMPEKGWEAIRKKLESFNLDQRMFSNWIVKTLRKNNLVVPEALNMLTNDAGSILWKIARASKNAGELVYEQPIA